MKNLITISILFSITTVCALDLKQIDKIKLKDGTEITPSKVEEIYYAVDRDNNVDFLITKLGLVVDSHDIKKIEFKDITNHQMIVKASGDGSGG